MKPAPELTRAHRRYVDMLALGLREPLWNLAPETGKPLLDSLINDKRIVRITVNDASLGTFLTTNLPERRQGRLYSQTHTIQKQGATVGSVQMKWMTDRVGRRSRQRVLSALAGRTVANRSESGAAAVQLSMHA